MMRPRPGAARRGRSSEVWVCVRVSTHTLADEGEGEGEISVSHKG